MEENVKEIKEKLEELVAIHGENQAFKDFTDDKKMFSWNDIKAMIEQASDYAGLDKEEIISACIYVLEVWKA